MPNIRYFKVDSSNFSQVERAIFDKLIKAAELIAPLYSAQKNEKYSGANFYPHDVSREKIEKEAEKNPAILNPYTFVERRKGNSLEAIPFHLKFRKDLKPIVRLLEEAARLSEDKNFGHYLKSRAQSLLDGDYEKSEIVWLKNEVFLPKFSLVIGPIERYLDKLFFKKCAYQAWVGILNEEKTKQAQTMKEMILSSQRKVLPQTKKVELPKLRIRIDETAIFSGLIADFMFTGTNLPNDVHLMRKYGSNLTIFNTSLAVKFEKDQMPVFRAVFSQKFQKAYSMAELYEGSLRCILLHEIAHSLIRYKDAEKRLKELFPVFDEILAYILGIRSCGSLLLKGVLSQKELEAILIMHICRNFTWWQDLSKNPEVKDYALGAAIAMNFFLKEKAIKIKNGISWPDFTKMFICIDELSRILEHYIALGSYQEARDFVRSYGSFDVFKLFANKLKPLTKQKKSLK